MIHSNIEAPSIARWMLDQSLDQNVVIVTNRDALFGRPSPKVGFYPYGNVSVHRLLQPFIRTPSPSFAFLYLRKVILFFIKWRLFYFLWKVYLFLKFFRFQRYSTIYRTSAGYFNLIFSLNLFLLSVLMLRYRLDDTCRNANGISWPTGAAQSFVFQARQLANSRAMELLW